MSRRRKMSILLVIIVTLASLTTSCARAPTAISVPMTLYESTEHGFSIGYPEEWAENVLRPGAHFSLEFKDPEERLSASVSVEYKTEKIILADMVSEAKAYLESMPQYELISEGNTTIGDILGYEIVGKGDLGTGKVEKFRFVTLARGKQGFWVGVSGEPAAFDQQEQIIDTIVDSFKLLPTYTFVPPTPGAGGTYTNAEHGFSITYPVEWMEAPMGRPGEVISFASAEGLPGVSVHVEPVGEGTTLAEFGPQLSQDLGQYWGDYELVSQSEITLDDGTPAYEIVFSGTMEGYTLKAKYVIVIHETKAFFIMGLSMPARFEQDEAVLDEVIHSFHLEWPPSKPTIVDEKEPTIVAPRLQNPVSLDGDISGNEWEDAGQLSLTFVYTHGESSLTYPGVIYLKHDGTYLWICIRVQDDDEDKFPEMYDYAAILFDASGDGDIGPGDDSAIIHHGLGPLDLRPDEDGVWLSDTEFGGNSDVDGQSGWAAGWYTYEMRKPLNTGDTNGYDIAISPGDTILSSSCFWDAGETTEHSADAGSFYIELEP